MYSCTAESGLLLNQSQSAISPEVMPYNMGYTVECAESGVKTNQPREPTRRQFTLRIAIVIDLQILLIYLAASIELCSLEMFVQNK